MTDVEIAVVHRAVLQWLVVSYYSPEVRFWTSFARERFAFLLFLLKRSCLFILLTQDKDNHDILLGGFCFLM